MIRQSGGAKQPAIYFIGKHQNNSRTLQESIQMAAATFKIVVDAKREKDQKKQEQKAEIANMNEIALQAAQGAGRVVLDMGQNEGIER